MTTKGKKSPKKEAPSRQLRVRLVRSLIGYPKSQREVARGLGLRGISSEVVRAESPEIWGMIDKISHVVKVEVLEKK